MVCGVHAMRWCAPCGAWWVLVPQFRYIGCIESVMGGVCCVICLTILDPCSFRHHSVTGRCAPRVSIKTQLAKLFVWYAGCRCDDVH